MHKIIVSMYASVLCVPLFTPQITEMDPAVPLVIFHGPGCAITVSGFCFLLTQRAERPRPLVVLRDTGCPRFGLLPRQVGCSRWSSQRFGVLAILLHAAQTRDFRCLASPLARIVFPAQAACIS